MKSRSTKEIILEIIGKEPKLTAKKIFNKIKNTYCVNLSYQAVYKTIQELTKVQILDKIENNYSISFAWIEKQKEYYNKLYENKNTCPKKKLVLDSENIKIYEFSNLIESDLFWCETLIKGMKETIQKNEIPITTWCGPYAWWIDVNLENEDSLLRELKIGGNVAYLKITKDILPNRMARDFYIQSETKTKIIPEENEIDFIGTSGQYILKISLTQELKENFQKYYEYTDPKEFKKKEFLDFMNNSKVRVELIKNQQIAKTIRDKIIEDITKSTK